MYFDYLSLLLTENIFSITVSLNLSTASQFLVGNLSRNLLGILHTGDTVWDEQNSINYFNLIYIHIFCLQTYLLLRGRIATSRHIILLVGGIEIEQLHRGDRNQKNMSNIYTCR